MSISNNSNGDIDNNKDNGSKVDDFNDGVINGEVKNSF
jgi:hypothetical protein